MTCPPPGSWTPVAAAASRARRRSTGPKPPPTATTDFGGAACSASIAAGSARGSAPWTGTTRAPAARAVAAAAASSRVTSTSTVTAKGLGATTGGRPAGSAPVPVPSRKAGTALPRTACRAAAPAARIADGDSRAICRVTASRPVWGSTSTGAPTRGATAAAVATPAGSPSATTTTTGACRNSNELTAIADPAPGVVSSTVMSAVGDTSSAACATGPEVVDDRVDAAGTDAVQAATVTPTATAASDERIDARAVIMALPGDAQLEKSV